MRQIFINSYVCICMYKRNSHKSVSNMYTFDSACKPGYSLKYTQIHKAYMYIMSIRMSLFLTKRKIKMLGPFQSETPQVTSHLVSPAFCLFPGRCHVEYICKGVSDRSSWCNTRIRAEMLLTSSGDFCCPGVSAGLDCISRP